MELYNSLISDIFELLPDTCDKCWDYDSGDCWNDKGISELVLGKDAAYELGASGKGSTNLVAFTSNPQTVNSDQIVLYGKDLSEIKADCDFARIVILKIGYIDEDSEIVYRTLKDIEFAKYHVFPEGYMVRLSPESYREQVRVSKDAVSKSISFRNIGNNYIREYKKNSNVLACRIIFVTDPAFKYSELRNCAQKSKNITETLTHIFEGLPTDCSACALKDICDEVEGMKELHFGINK